MIAKRVARMLIGLCMVSSPLLGCDSVDPGPLRVLNSDPMAHVALAKGVQERRDEQDAGIVLGKPRRAQILTVYTPRDGVTLADLQDEGVQTAQKAGWALSRPSSNFAEAQKREGDITVELSIYPDDDGTHLIVLLRQK